MIGQEGDGLEHASAVGAASDRTEVPSDDALVAAALVDPDVFGSLYIRHRMALFRFVRARATDDESAADIVATTFERAIAALPRYRPAGAGFRAWLFRIARNETINIGRRTRTFHRRLAKLQRIDDRHPSPEDAIVAAEDAALVRELVAALPPVQRDALLLRYAGGLSTSEIAVVIGRSEAAAQKLISRGLAMVREEYRATDG